jgi:hypothetical protein
VNEFNIDGYRFDLSKGFTQNVTTSVNAWGAKDNSRIALLKRMADRIWENNSDTWVILEHFADNNEEIELADYGMMLWGNMHWDYKDLGIGVAKNIAWTYHGTRGWQNPNLIGYMESHDEERIMLELVENGKSSGSYNVKDEKTALARIKALSAFFYTIPGPKMLWQFGELAYDKSINLCEDRNIDNGCRTNPKPVLWNYYEEDERVKLRQTISELIHLKTTYPVFVDGNFTMTNETGFLKHITLANKDDISSPANANDMSVYLIGNFDVTTVNVNAVFPFTGTWYSFFDGGEEWNVTNEITGITLKPGQFKLFVNFPIDFPDSEIVNPITGIKKTMDNGIAVYPNPANHYLQVDLGRNRAEVSMLKIVDVSGRTILHQEINSGGSMVQLDVSPLKPGPYQLIISSSKSYFTTHLMIK